MPAIRVILNDKDFVQKEIARINAKSEKDVENIAKRCESVIRYTIENKTEGGTGKLANSDGWTAKPIAGGWGVGDIDFLNNDVKYWRHLNYGSLAIGANWDHYLPKGFWLNGRWVENSAGYSGIKPKTPIEPLNYIESTLAQMEIEIPRVLKETK